MVSWQTMNIEKGGIEMEFRVKGRWRSIQNESFSQERYCTNLCFVDSLVPV